MCLRFDYDWIVQSAIFVPPQTQNIQKNIQTREKIVYTTKLSGFKVPTLDSGFKISGDTTKPGSL